MKKIITKGEQDKITYRNQIIIGLVLILLMVFSTLGYALTGRGDNEGIKKISYKGIDFIQEDSEYWSFNMQDYGFMTRYNPTETENIFFFDYLNLQDYSNKPLYFVGTGEPVYEISRNLNPFVLRMQEACLNEENCSENLPLKNCSDNVIVIREPLKNENNKIYQENNCVFIIAELENQTMYSDVFLFRVLGL